jgi:hypothetical protein
MATVESHLPLSKDHRRNPPVFVQYDEITALAIFLWHPELFSPLMRKRKYKLEDGKCQY